MLLAAAALWFCAAAAAAQNPRTILFVDDDDVLYRPGTIKRIVPFRKAANNPVVPPNKAWEGMLGWTSVYRNPQTGKFQMWYQAYQERRKEDKSLKCVVCYAESDDGRNWTKPGLDLFPFYEEKITNIVLVGAGGKEGGYGDRYCNSVVVDPRDPDPARRYKMAYYDWSVGARTRDGAGAHVAFSPDGIHWKKYEGGLVYATALGDKGLQPPFQGEDVYSEDRRADGTPRKIWRVPFGMSDAVDVLYDPLRGVFAIYGKMWTPFPDGSASWKHGMGRTESRDFIHWSKPQLLLTVNDQDPPQLEFHTSPVFFHNGQYFSINQILDRAVGTMDSELMSSRDGLRWDRTFARIPPIPRGTGEVFDAGSMVSNGTPVMLEKEMLFYYAAYRGTAIGGVGLNRQIVGSTDYFSGVGLAIAPRDRFVAVGINPKSPVKGQKRDAPQLVNTIGNVTLWALDFTGVTTLTVNADASKGAVRIEILDEDGFRIRGFSREEALPLSTDGLALEARWNAKTLRDLPAGRYLVRAHLEQADLFAVTLR
ncbi:MAG: hypothetical protein EXS32_05525 [Opitutus sp.]|nr:hypothetical protein [Opitutus sp.]